MKRLLALVFLSLGLCHARTVEAKGFRNGFIEFELPDGWTCNLTGSEWTCMDERPDGDRSAIIIFAAKYRGEMDTLEVFRDHLSQPKDNVDAVGKPMRSTVLSAKTVSIQGHPWIDATHADSEVRGFQTRYFATVREDIALVVTFTAREDRFKAYVADMDAMVGTLRSLRSRSSPTGAASSAGEPATRPAAPPSAPPASPATAPPGEGGALWTCRVRGGEGDPRSGNMALACLLPVVRRRRQRDGLRAP